MIETIMLTRTKGEWVDLLESVRRPLRAGEHAARGLADPRPGHRHDPESPSTASS